MEKVHIELNKQYCYFLTEIQRLDSKINRIEEQQEHIKQDINVPQIVPQQYQMDSYDIILQSRNIRMIQDKMQNTIKQFEQLKESINSKVCLDEFHQYTQKIAQEYATLQMLDLSIQQLVESKTIPTNNNDFMKNSLIISKNMKLNKNIQVYEYQHSIENNVEERLERFRELIISQVRQFCENIQHQDITKPYREQIQNNIQIIHEKLHQIELFQFELQRHQEIREYENLVKQHIDFQSRLQLIENNTQSIENTLKTINQQKQEKQKQKIKIKQEKQLKIKQQNEQIKQENLYEKFISKEDLQKYQQYIEETFLKQIKWAELLQRINQIEDNIKQQFNKDIYQTLQNDIYDLDEKFGTLLANFEEQKLLELQQIDQKIKNVEMQSNQFYSKSEIIQMLDNPQSMMKINSAVKDIQERFKELYQRSIEIMEQNFKFNIGNMQSANISENEKLNQQKLLLTKCDNAKLTLLDYFGQSKQSINQKQNQQSQIIQRKYNIEKQRPLSVCTKKPKIRLNSATPKVTSTSFSINSTEPQFFQRVIQNPLIQKLKSVQQ